MFRAKRPSSIAAVSVANQYEVGRGAELCAWALNTWRNWVDLFSSVQFSHIPSLGCERALKPQDSTTTSMVSVSVYSRHLFLGGGISPTPSLLNFLAKRLPILCALNHYRPGQWITNISRKLSFYGQQTQKIIRYEAIKTVQIYAQKIHQNTLGGRVPPGPAGGAYALPQIP